MDHAILDLPTGDQTLALSMALDIWLVLDGAATVVQATPNAARVFGARADELTGRALETLLHDIPASQLADLLRQARSGRRVRLSLCLTLPHRPATWLECVLIRQGNGPLLHLVGHDVTAHKAAETKLQHAADHDALTDLPNRRSFAERLSQALDAARSANRMVAVCQLDLDGFKKVNDTRGHAVGDALLVEVAQRLRRALRAGDLVARISGDEFALLLCDVKRPDDVRVVAQRALTALAMPISVGDLPAYVTGSLGTALYPRDAETAADLMALADGAMYAAKATGRDRYVMHNEDLAEAKRAAVSLDGEIQEGLRNGEFAMHYQPLVSADGTLRGAEALMRWTRPGGRNVSPAQFIPAAEQGGLMAILGGWSLRASCAQAAAFRRDGLSPFYVSVNVSARQFPHPNFVDTVAAALKQSGLAPQALMLEITEGVLLDDPQRSRETVEALRALGVQVAIDDFGTGYSSLSYLRHLPVSHLKIDRSFVSEVTADPRSAAIVRSILDLARNLDIEPIAEGVETVAQRDALDQMGCRAFQGWLFSKALPAHEFQTRYHPNTAAPGA